MRLAGFCGRLSPRFRSESEATPLKKIPKGLSEPYQSPLTTYEFVRVGNRERGLQSQQRETKKERDAWGSFSKNEEVSQG